MKIAVVFDRLGPYHHARLNALGKVSDVLAIEIHQRDQTYQWDIIQGSEHFKKVTLFAELARPIRLAEIFARPAGTSQDGFKPDVIVVAGWSGRWILASTDFAISHDIPMVVMSESTKGDFNRAWLKEALKSRLVRLADAYLAGGSRPRDYLVELGAAPASVFLGCDAVDNGYFLAGAREARLRGAALRKELGLPKNFFLSSFRFVAKKNPLGLVRAYAHYAAHAKSPWDLVILGDGPLRSEVERQVDSLGLRGRVHMPGFMQYADLPQYYGLAGAFILASLSDQWGLVVNEAMAAGLPVLVSNRCGCVDDLVHFGGNGFTFDPGDHETLGLLMVELSGGGVDLRGMGRRSRQLVTAWSPESFAKNMLGACNYAVRSHVRRTSWFDCALLRTLVLCRFPERKD